MLTVVMLMASFFMHSSVYIEQMDGWVLTPVHQDSPSLQKDEKRDRTVVSSHEASKLSFHKSISCWIREKQDGIYYLCAVKNGLLFEYNLSGDDKSWGHLPETLKNLREFAKNGGEETFCQYWENKLGRKKCQAIENACMAAMRDLQHKQTEPDAGGWNFVFKRNKEFCKSACGDLGGHIRVCDTEVVSRVDKDQRHYDDTVWVRYCGNQRYVYGSVRGGMFVYNLSGDDKHWKQNPDKLLWLKKFDTENFQWTNKAASLFRRNTRKFIHALIYGIEGERFNALLEKGLPHPNDRNGWRVWPMMEDHHILRKNVDDFTISGSTNSDNYFKDRAVWLRKNAQRQRVLCSWRQGIFYTYENLESFEGWKHLPATLTALQKLSATLSRCKPEETEHDFSSVDEDRVDTIMLKNGCIAAVRDYFCSSIEMLPGCSLTCCPWEGVCCQAAGDLLLQQYAVHDYCYSDGSIWLHACGGEYFFKAVVNGSLFQCKVFCKKSAPYWKDFPELFAVLKKVCQPTSIHERDQCLTFPERMTLRNGCRRFIYEALYKGQSVQLERGWTVERSHQMLSESYEDCPVKRSHLAKTWWRFDGQESLCVQYKGLLLRYNLASNQCAPEEQQNIKDLQHKSKKLFELGEDHTLGLDHALRSALAAMGERVVKDNTALLDELNTSLSN